MAVLARKHSSDADCRGLRWATAVRHLQLLAIAVSLAGCDRGPAPNPATSPGKITVASISPAATDLIVGMGAKDHLVAVSNFDQTRAETRDLPGVGDYRTLDWEKIAELRPAVLIVQFRADKMPTGLAERAAGYGIRLINVEINRLDHIYKTLDQLGTAIGEPAKAAAAAEKLRSQLAAVAKRVAGRPVVQTLISRTDNPLEAVGGGNFLDDVLTIAGGKNVLSGPGYDDNSYPTLDRELLLSLNPDAVLSLLPAASPQVVAKTKDFWQTMPVAAQKTGQVHYLLEEYLLWPGLNVGNIAERFAGVLHPVQGTTLDGRDHHGGTEARRSPRSIWPPVVILRYSEGPCIEHANVGDPPSCPLLRYSGGGLGTGLLRETTPNEERRMENGEWRTTRFDRDCPSFAILHSSFCILCSYRPDLSNPLPNPPPEYRRRGLACRPPCLRASVVASSAMEAA